MRRHPIPLSSAFFISDFAVLGLIVAFIYGLTTFGHQWQASYNPDYKIDLDLAALPVYSLFSALRGLVAYVISLTFTIIVGYWAAKSERAEKYILPFLDIMQSIPVLGFLPGLVLGLVALFPKTNTGLELASILLIFTGQVWNMAFAFYSSLKSIPTDLGEATSIMRLSALERFRFLELPFSAMNLTWNSVMSMAGGWFFLTVCEAFTLGDKSYRLPGLGAYMAVAIDAGDTRAIVAAIVAMALVIILFDIFLWQPALAWAHSFRLEETDEDFSEEPLMRFLVRDSRLFRFVKVIRHRQRLAADPFKKYRLNPARVVPKRLLKALCKVLGHVRSFDRFMPYVATTALVVGLGYAAVQLVKELSILQWSDWSKILLDTAITFVRVLAAVIIGTLWATPFGIWVSQSPRRLKVAQPIIQLMASFPAPMLYPLAIAVFLFLNINFEISSMLLMLLGVQWYILFNVLAGGLRIPTELKLAMNLMESSRRDKWRFLYLPSVFPSLVTGWVTAAGGAWNASIVSEVVAYHGHKLLAHGLGADISQAADSANFPKLAACLVVMVVVVVTLNRTFWSRIYRLAQTRYRLDL